MPIQCVRNSCEGTHFIKDGFFYRTSDRKHIQRWKCNLCRARFSSATYQRPYRQNKRQVNFMVSRLLSSGMSIRRISIIMNLHRITIARKLAFLAEVALEKQHSYLTLRPKAIDIQLDDLITIEHTKRKPLAVSVVVENKSRQILGFEVSVIPASGPLAHSSKVRYGFRPNRRKQGIQKLLGRVKQYVSAAPTIRTDEDAMYPKLIKHEFSDCVHIKYKGASSRGNGLGELKKLKYDPLFSINHTMAMLRANINRLFRRTWCTTKKRERLYQHLAVYMHFHNSILTTYPTHLAIQR